MKDADTKRGYSDIFEGNSHHPNLGAEERGIDMKYKEKEREAENPTSKF